MSVINQTVHALHNGQLVVFPSDTVYGLLVDATNEQAVKKLISFKNRAPGKAISIFVADMDMLAEQLEVTSEKLRVIKQLLPGPFTIVLPSRHRVSPLLESEKGTLGVRIPQYPSINTLCQTFGKPITATSANLGGRHPHYSIQSLLHQLPENKKQLIDLIVDVGKLPRNKPSTVLDLTTSDMKIVRKGDIIPQQKEEFFSHTPEETQKIGTDIIHSLLKKNSKKPIVIILQGDLGTGKTEMTRGIAYVFGITAIDSPTFVVFYEYSIEDNKANAYKLFIHVDLYNVQEEEEFAHLGLEQYLKPGNVMVIEWGEKLGALYETFRKQAEVVFVQIAYEGETGRKITIIKYQ